MRFKSVFLGIVGCLPFLAGCDRTVSIQKKPELPIVVDLESRRPAKLLSEYGLFIDLKNQVPNVGVFPYELNSTHFADYTRSRHYLYVPPGTQAVYQKVGIFKFTFGTVLIQTLYYLNDIRDASKGEKQIETRLLIHQNKGWLGVPYVWNETGDDARRAVAGRKTPVSWKHFDGSDRAHNFVTPNMNQCKQCHVNREVMAPIGMKVENLNRDVEFVQGTKNQLKHWDDLGLINDVPSDVETGSKFPVWNDPTTGDVLSRARAWLEVNCAHCHNPEGPANVTGLDLSYHQEDPGRFGVYKPPVAAGRGSRGLRFSIEPGKPEKSFLLHRIQSTELGVMMPTLGRKLVDEEGASLIADWIRQIVPDNDAEQRMLNPMDTFRDALIFEDAKLGRNLFYSKYLCVTCHTADQPDGGNIGPKLNGIGSRLQPEAILESIVSPSAKITEGYAPILITYNQDETISGRIVFEDEHTITLALPDGTNLSIDKTKITKRETSDQSPMPSMAGLFTVEEAGALTSFLVSLTE